MSHKILDNNLVAIHKRKLRLKLNKPVYIGICISELCKLLIHEFHYDYIKNKYGKKSKVLFRNTDSLIYETKTEDFYKDCSDDKEMFEFSNYSMKSKYYDNSNKLVIGKRWDDDNSNKLVVGKRKDKTGGVTIEEFVRVEPKMYLFLVDNSEHKKSKSVKRNVVATISHNEYKDVEYKVIQYKISLTCFDDKIYIQNNEYDGLALGYQRELIGEKQFS